MKELVIGAALLLAGCHNPNDFDAGAMAERGRTDQASCHRQAATLKALGHRKEAATLCVEGDMIQSAIEDIARNQAAQKR